jgi:hypothetical protein
MKLALAIIAILIVVGSFYADYKWRQWMAERHQDRDTSAPSQNP